MVENKVLTSLYCWFDISRDEIIKNHKGERVLIHNNSVVGYYPDKESALIAARDKGLKLGEFLVQRCITAEEDICYVYTPGVYFG